MEAANDGMELVLQAIRHGVTAGGLSVGAVRYPEAAKGLTKARDFHHARVGALLEEMLAGTGRGALPGCTSLG